MFQLLFTDEAVQQFSLLEQNKTWAKRFKAVRKTLAYLQANPRHPSLNTHKYSSIKGEMGEDVFEAYAENNTPSAYRIFWHYGKKGTIIIVAITPHP